MTFPTRLQPETSDNVVEMHAVVPLPDCPHLTEVRNVPQEGVNAEATCSVCHSEREAWLCLTCYGVHCGRYIHGHGLEHQEQTGHSMALSLADLTVWCYRCEAYVHNEILIPVKSAVHQSKFGTLPPCVR